MGHRIHAEFISNETILSDDLRFVECLPSLGVSGMEKALFVGKPEVAEGKQR
jgi:hypothetical protein